MSIKDLKKLEPDEQLEVGPTYHNTGGTLIPPSFLKQGTTVV